MSVGQHLLLTVRLRGDGHGTARFHGMAQGGPEWPPSPARLFQALVAGVARGHDLPEALVPAFEWLEMLPPPVIAAPRRRLGQGVQLFVPNNDADALPDPRQVGEIRTKKVVQPSLFSEDVPLLYAWSFSDCVANAEAMAAAAGQLYQLGRGVDMAWAVGEVLEAPALEQRLDRHPGIVHHPQNGVASERRLACPTAGSLASLVVRHRTARLTIQGSGRNTEVVFTNSPKPRFASVSYERKRSRVVFELHERDLDRPWPWPMRRVVELVETLRDAAAARLREGLPALAEQVESSLVGRKPDGSARGPIEHRVRIVPLPSIGSDHADRGVRRFSLEIPSGSTLPAADIEWAFSGLEGVAAGDGAAPWVVTRTDEDMLRHYLGPSRSWRTVTPLALPDDARRRRIEPSRQRTEAKPASERASEETNAVAALHVALRHAGVRGTAVAVRVQREPFERKGVRAEAFAEGTRFAKERLWHVELEFDRPVQGPLVLGDGRFLGLGVMAPYTVPRTPSLVEVNSALRPVLALPGDYGVLVLEATGLAESRMTDLPLRLARALRRAILACVQHEIGSEKLERFFTGHEVSGAKATGAEANHLGFQWDGLRRRFVVIAPHCLERRAPTWEEQRQLKTLDRALENLEELRAGLAGSLHVRRGLIRPEDPLLLNSHCWTSLTPYAVTRHLKGSTASEALTRDLIVECERRRLPRPEVTVLGARGVDGRGLEGHVQLDFRSAVAGPIVLGRSRYLGGGLFTGDGEGPR